MNNVLMKVVAVLLGAVVYAFDFLLGPTKLHLLARFYPETTMPTDMSWRVGVTITISVITFITFGIAGWAIGRLRPSGGWTWGIWLAVFPALAEGFLYFIDGVVYPLTLLASFAAVVAGGIAGAHLGASSRGAAL